MVKPTEDEPFCADVLMCSLWGAVLGPPLGTLHKVGVFTLAPCQNQTNPEAHLVLRILDEDLGPMVVYDL